MSTTDRSLVFNRKLALIIGNDNYTDSKTKLSSAVSSAGKLQDSLEKIDFQVFLHSNINGKDMVEGLGHFYEEIKKDDLVLFYFAGHGCQVNGENYLIPVDDDNMKSEKDVQDFAIGLKGILNRLEKRHPFLAIIIVNCSRPYLLKSSSKPALKPGLCELVPLDRTFVQFACDVNQTINHSSLAGHNDLFTKHLLAHIDAKNVSISEVFRRVSNDVRQESGGRQRPLSMNGLGELGKVFLNETFSSLPDIPHDAKWGKYGSTVAGGFGLGLALNEMHSPKGLCVDSKRRIFVADSGNNRIMQYMRGKRTGRRMAGNSMFAYAGEGLLNPSDVVFDEKSQCLFICDRHNRRLLRWYRDKHTFVEIIQKDIECCGLALDDEGSLYVSDTEHHEVRKYARGKKHGVVVAGGHGKGRRLDQLNYPTYICLGPDQSIYVADSRNNRVVRWDKGAKSGVVIVGSSQLHYPTGIVVDRLGALYVSDYSNHRVMRFHRDSRHGIVIAGRSRAGERSYELDGPKGLAFDTRGNLYVSDSENNRIQRFNISRSEH